LRNPRCSQKAIKKALVVNVNTPLPAHLFPDDNIWNQPIQAGVTVDPQNNQILAFHAGNNLGAFAHVECAIPYNVISTSVGQFGFISITGQSADG
jgi:hypothetical protein